MQKSKSDRKKSKTECKIDSTIKKEGSEKETDREAETVGTPANLIMTGCELDSLTDGPGAKLKGAAASSEGTERGEDGQEERDNIKRGGKGEE